MKTISMADILQLDVSERIQLVEDIWDSIAIMPVAVNLSDAQRKTLDRRLESYRRNPNAGASWEDVKKRILNRWPAKLNKM